MEEQFVYNQEHHNILKAPENNNNMNQNDIILGHLYNSMGGNLLQGWANQANIANDNYYSKSQENNNIQSQQYTNGNLKNNDN